MELLGEQLIPLPIDKVWAGLNDPEVLRQCIPGCNEMLQTGEGEFTASVVAKVGPVSATFKGKVQLSDLNPPHSYTLSGRGQGGPAGFAKGVARVSLSERGDSTLLAYKADFEIGGKLASVGGRLVQGVAKKNADDFFSALSRVLAGGSGIDARQAPGQPFEAPADQRSSHVSPAAHIPLIDRVAWLLVGVAIGVAGAYFLGVGG